MPYGSVDPSPLEGDDLVRWYRRTPWEVEQERQAARLQQYNDFFGVKPGGDYDGQTPDDSGSDNLPDVSNRADQSLAFSQFPPQSTGTTSNGLGLLGDLSWLKNSPVAGTGAPPTDAKGAAPAASSTEPPAQDNAAPAPGFDVHSFSDLVSPGLSLDPSKPIWAPGAVSVSPPMLDPTLKLSAGPTRASNPPPSSRGQSSGTGQRPSAGILGAIFPWAVPTPGGRSLKSAMVTNPSNPRVGPDPSRVDVFQRGADGKLHPIPGWHTTGPFDFGTWSHEIDAKGTGEDLGHIAEGVMDVEGINAAGEVFLDALGPGVRKAVQRGIFGPGHGHHPIPKFMGGAADQTLADMAPPMHRAFHEALVRELRKAGFPPVGGTSGSAKIWQKMFAEDPAKREQAIEILKRVTRDFDIERGTSVGPYLDRELGMVKPGSPPPTK
jgi:hypothetical protein